MKPLTVAAASLLLTLLTLIALLMSWAKGRNTVDDMEHTRVASNGFGHVVSSTGQGRSRAGYLLLGLLLLVLLLAAIACLVLTTAQKVGAGLLGAAGALEVVYSIVAMATGMGKNSGFGIASSQQFDSYFWLVSYSASVGGGVVFALILGFLTLGLAVPYLLRAPKLSASPSASLRHRV